MVHKQNQPPSGLRTWKRVFLDLQPPPMPPAQTTTNVDDDSNPPYPVFDSRVDKVTTTETATFSCGSNDIGPITGRITPMHSGLYFLDFVGADGKRLLIENKISVWDVNDGPVRIFVGTGSPLCTEEFYYVSSARAYQVKYEGKVVKKISFQRAIQIYLE